MKKHSELSASCADLGKIQQPAKQSGPSKYIGVDRVKGSGSCRGRIGHKGTQVHQYARRIVDFQLKVWFSRSDGLYV